ncbi:Hypothetical_protein [Hexamita inflata]|uniref:Hypothetical_protein n=1 Tax=Hexamita inflata TaxID=28002 RepID=A0AA86UQI9_9EUKA|nr:Hypothetical protein HINF_LOCUS34758 [Hexamita inflata]
MTLSFHQYHLTHPNPYTHHHTQTIGGLVVVAWWWSPGPVSSPLSLHLVLLLLHLHAPGTPALLGTRASWDCYGLVWVVLGPVAVCQIENMILWLWWQWWCINALKYTWGTAIYVQMDIEIVYFQRRELTAGVVVIVECEYIIKTVLGVESNSSGQTVLLISCYQFFWLNPGLSSLPGSRVIVAFAVIRKYLLFCLNTFVNWSVWQHGGLKSVLWYFCGFPEKRRCITGQRQKELCRDMQKYR